MSPLLIIFALMSIPPWGMVFGWFGVGVQLVGLIGLIGIIASYYNSQK